MISRKVAEKYGEISCNNSMINGMIEKNINKEQEKMNIKEFYNGKKILITGHTGFKGSWMCRVLIKAGAEVIGYALKPPTDPALFVLDDKTGQMCSVVGDVRNLKELNQLLEETKPEIVFHLAAQPLVRESYNNPVYTYETNVMGTVNLLECVRKSETVKSVLNVTTDKVYKNKEWEWGYRESEELNGYDPYSNSKSCSELVTDSYKNSFLQNQGIAVSTARAGNVIGGGDFAKDRIIPDCIRAAEQKKNIMVRNPFSIRPYQHVLEPVMAYLLIAQKQYEDIKWSGSYNIGPEEKDCITTGELAGIFCESWYKYMGEKAFWINQDDRGPHEANFLKLDCSKMKQTFGWKPVWNVGQAVDKTVEWNAAYEKQENITECMERQIEEYLSAYE